MSIRIGDPVGSALLEVVVAAGLLVTVAVGVSQLVSRAIRASVVARSGTTTAVLAAQKMEQLRGLSWSSAADGLPISDLTTDLSSEPATSSGPGLARSPAGTLETNSPPYVDYVDAMGTWVGNGPSPPGTAVYARRWSVQPGATDPDTLVLQVIVTTSLTASGAATAESQVVSLKTRHR
jgi:hypothetical protein